LQVLRLGIAVNLQGTCFDRLSATNCGATLRVLDFNNRSIPNQTMLHLADVCKGLQTLGLANSPQPMSHQALKRLFVGCPLLKDLSVTIGPDAAKLDCFANLPNLRYLYMVLFNSESNEDDDNSNNNFFDDEAIETLAEGGLYRSLFLSLSLFFSLSLYLYLSCSLSFSLSLSLSHNTPLMHFY